MGLFDRLFGAGRGEPPTPPKPPQLEGDVMFVSGPTGMVQTTDKQALSFRVEECRGFTPKERQRVGIERVEGMSAKGLVLLVDVPTVVARPVEPTPHVAVRDEPAVLDWTAIGSCFGAPLGPLLRALVELCFRLDPKSPADALGSVFLLLDWIPPGTMSVDERRVDGLTPQSVWPFAATGADLEHFGFLMDDGDARSMDERPVVFVAKDVPSAHVIAPNLASFLGLVAWTGWPQIERRTTDHEHAEMRAEQLEDDDVRACMDALLTLPGVVVPPSPMRVVRRTRDVWFDDVAGPAPASWTRPKDDYDALRMGWLRLRDGDALGALDAVSSVGGSDVAVATRIRWNARYELRGMDALRDDVERNIEALTQSDIPGGQAAYEDLVFLIEESKAAVSPETLQRLANACGAHAQNDDSNRDAHGRA